MMLTGFGMNWLFWIFLRNIKVQGYHLFKLVIGAGNVLYTIPPGYYGISVNSKKVDCGEVHKKDIIMRFANRRKAF